MVGNGRQCGDKGQPTATYAVYNSQRVLQGSIPEREYCGCQVLTVDFCLGGGGCGPRMTCKNGKDGPICECADGYERQADGSCVDTTALKLELLGDNPLRVIQVSVGTRGMLEQTSLSW